MAKELTIGSWLESFEGHLAALEAADQRVSRLLEFGGGFEGWLKFEMASLLTAAPWNFRPWIKNSPGDVGIEYRAALHEHETKLIDLWASPYAKAKAWNFVELKLAFNNYNARKQFASWRSDLEALRRIDRSKDQQVPASIGSIMFGVGFEKPEFEELIESSRIEAQPRKPRLSSLALRQGDLWIAALIE